MRHDVSLTEVIDALFSTASEKASAVVAGAMISAPVWHEWLKTVNYEASLLAAPLGVIWLLLQIAHKIYTILSKDNAEEGT